jgi:hypothetical protein
MFRAGIGLDARNIDSGAQLALEVTITEKEQLTNLGAVLALHQTKYLLRFSSCSQCNLTLFIDRILYY